MAGVFQTTIVDEEGNVIAAADVEVRHQVSGALATIYSDFDLQTPIANPTTTDSNGFVRFYGASGLYQITATSGAFTQQWRHHAIGLTIDDDTIDTIEGLEGLAGAQAQEIADNVADIDRIGAGTIENTWRLFIIGTPENDYTEFLLNTTKLNLPSGVTLQEQFNTIETDTLLLGEDISLLGARNGAGTAFVLETSTVKLDSDGGETLAERFTAIDASIDAIDTSGITANTTAISLLDGRVTTAEGTITTQGSAITALQSNLTDAEEDIDANATAVSALDTRVTANEGDISAQASSISSLSATVGGHTSSITTLNSVTATNTGDITALEAKYGVSLNVGGYITGFVQNNDGSTGTFDILTDKFRIVDPASGGQNPTQVFTISGGNVHLQNLFMSGSLLVDGTITGPKLQADAIDATHIDVDQLDSIVANTGTLNVDEAIRIGSATAFGSGIGIWEGMDGGTAKWRAGNPAGQQAYFDGTNFVVVGNFVIDDAAVESFTPSWTGFSANPSGDMYYYDLGPLVVVWSNTTLTGASNAQTFTFGTLPSAIRPSAVRKVQCNVIVTGSFTWETMGMAEIGTDGTVTMYRVWNDSSASWFEPDLWNMAGTTKGLPNGWYIMYPK